MSITWSEILYIARGQFECQLSFPGKTALDWAREKGHTEMVNLLMGKASWLRGWGRRTAASQWHSRWTCQRIKHGWTASAGGDKNMKRGGDSVSSHKGCLHIRFSTNESLTPIAASSSKTTGQQLRAGEPRIWLNLPNMEIFWLKHHATHSISVAFKNKLDYQIKHRQNRYVFFGVWLSSAWIT